MAAADGPTRDRRLVLVERASDAGATAPGTDVLVLDASFTPMPGGRPDLIPIRPALARVLDRINLFDQSTGVLDRWAAATNAPERYRIGDATWWFRVRLTARWPIHETLLWRAVLEELAARDRYQSIEVPAAREAVVAAARLVAHGGDAGQAVIVIERETPEPGTPEPGTTEPGTTEPGTTEPGPSPTMRLALLAGRSLASARHGLRRLERIVTRSPRPPTRRERVALELERRLQVLDQRVQTLRTQPDAVLVVATAGFFQLIDTGTGDGRFADPHLAPIADRVAERGIPVVTLGLQLDHRRAADWPMIESQPSLVPQSLLGVRWSDQDDDAPAAAALDAFLASDTTVVDVDGADFGPVIRNVLAAEYGSRYLLGQARATARAARMIAELRPRVMVLDHEGGRTAYLAAARRGGVPVVAVQHGVIVEGNAEYCHPLHELLVRQDMTCVYGPYEQAVLTGPGGFPPQGVVVTGSSRAGPVLASTPPSAAERAQVRRELGVRDGDRMLVVSLAHNPIGGDLHTVNMVARTLGGPLPGVHVVFKLHPQERSESRYAATLEGLAAAGGYAPPAITVVRDFDLYRLLRSADAHLGQYSTILTDAVVANTPNMIAIGFAWSDLLGYVDAGVAVPVRAVDDVRSFMRDPRPAEPAARSRFLEAHFRPGDATGRIVDVLLGPLPIRPLRDGESRAGRDGTARPRS